MSPKLKKYVIFSLQSNILWLQFLFKKLRVRLRLHRRHYFFTLNFPCRDAQQRNRHPWNVSTNTKVITVTLSGNEIALEEQWSPLNKELILSAWTSRQCMKWALLTMTTAESCRVFFLYSPQSESKSGAAWGRGVCLLALTPSSLPSYIQRRHPGSRRLSLGSLWRTAPLLISSLPTLPAFDRDVTLKRLRKKAKLYFGCFIQSVAVAFEMKCIKSHLSEAAFSQESQKVEVAEPDPVHVTWGQTEPPVVCWCDHFLTVAQLGFLLCTMNTHTHTK